MKKVRKVSCVILKKGSFFSNLLGTQYLFEILNALLTVTNGENVVFDGVP